MTKAGDDFQAFFLDPLIKRSLRMLKEAGVIVECKSCGNTLDTDHPHPHINKWAMVRINGVGVAAEEPIDWIFCMICWNHLRQAIERPGLQIGPPVPKPRRENRRDRRT